MTPNTSRALKAQLDAIQAATGQHLPRVPNFAGTEVCDAHKVVYDVPKRCPLCVDLEQSERREAERERLRRSYVDPARVGSTRCPEVVL